MKKIGILFILLFALFPICVNAEDKVIQKINIVISEPIIGQSPDLEAKVYAEENYLTKNAASLVWLVSTDGSNFEIMESGTFEEGKYYRFEFGDDILASGYIFGEKTAYYINGKIYKLVDYIIPTETVPNTMDDIFPALIICGISLSIIIGSIIYIKRKQIN